MYSQSALEHAAVKMGGKLGSHPQSYPGHAHGDRQVHATQQAGLQDVSPRSIHGEVDILPISLSIPAGIQLSIDRLC